MSRPAYNPWLHRFAVLTAAATLALIGIGGLVTSHEAGMAVPDWPTSYGYNMFALPIHFWKGGIFYEHSHRLWATVVGVLVVALTRWLGGRKARWPMAIIGLGEVLAGIAIFSFWPNLKGTGHFLTGIGGVVLLAALVWVSNEPAERPLPLLGWLLFGLVQFQGLLGGLRVVLLKDQLGVFHATLAQLFFVLTCVVALLTHRKWAGFKERRVERASGTAGTPVLLFMAAAALILFQLILGATMRHQHAGLAIPDFPLAYGKVWPATDADSVASYNQHRMETTGVNAITAFQIVLQMTHRITAVLILALVTFCVWRVHFGGRRLPPHVGGYGGKVLRRMSVVWLGLILFQVVLGAATVLSQKAADVATAHVLAGALSLATGGLLCIVSACSPQSLRPAPNASNADAREDGSSWSVRTAATR